ncbi:SAM-dependent methyltransferase [Candidatus Pacearchaeota archaeon]|nr:SAM-dependent methyltransferase [Candidatus Pacearchaeota archaeon]
MGKRSNFERKPRDYYQTPIEAVEPLLPHLPEKGLFAEPCAGDGRLIRHIEELTGLSGYWMTDIEPQADFIGDGDALTDQIVGCDICITNPPWGRKILHPLIDNLSNQLPTWLLFDVDWMHTKQSIPYMKMCSKIVSVGRIKWFGNMVGKDNCGWYLFEKDAKDTIFYGRT